MARLVPVPPFAGRTPALTRVNCLVAGVGNSCRVREAECAMMSEQAGQPFIEQTDGEAPVHGFVHRAEHPTGFLVLTHGAGGNSNAPLLVALSKRFADAGITTLRC